MRTRLTTAIATLTLVFLPFAAFAHQPRLVESASVTVSAPEVSKAYYGRLTGEPHAYRLDAAEPFDLYLNVLVPDMPSAKKDVSAALFLAGRPDSPFIVLDGLSATWFPFYEDFGDDKYFQGPEHRERLPAGAYEIRVWSSNNDSAYVLAIGEREEFPPGEILNALRIMPTIKERFFGKPGYTAYLTPFILGKAVPVLIGIALLITAAVIIRRRARKTRP